MTYPGEGAPPCTPEKLLSSPKRGHPDIDHPYGLGGLTSVAGSHEEELTGSKTEVELDNGAVPLGAPG